MSMDHGYQYWNSIAFYPMLLSGPMTAVPMNSNSSLELDTDFLHLKSIQATH